MNEPLEKRLQELRDQASLFAEAEAKRSYLDNYKHSKLAILMKEFEGPDCKSVAAQEREARAHPEFIELLGALRDATEIAEKNKWFLNIAMRGSSLYQTQQATLRAEMNAYNSK